MYPSLPMIGKRQCELAVLTSSVNNDYCRSTVMMGGVKGQCQAVAKLCKDTVPASIFYYSTALGRCKRTNRVCRVEVVGRALTGHVVCCYLAMHMHPTLAWNIGTYSIAVACCMAYTPSHLSGENTAIK